MNRLTRDRTAERVSRDQTLRHERGQTGKYLFSLFGLFGYDSITVSYAWELSSVIMCYPQRDGFSTSLSRLLPDSVPL